MKLTPKQSRRFISRSGMLLGIIFLLSVIDLVMCDHLQQKGSVRVMVGMRQAVSGDLAVPVHSADDVIYRTKSPVFLLKIVEARGRLWRGTLEAPLSASPGTYDLQVFSAFDPSPEKSARLKVMIFDSEHAMRYSYPSILRKLLGIAPGWMVIASLPLLIATLIISSRLSTQQELRLAHKGFAPIIKLARRSDHWEITAALAGGIRIDCGDTIDLVSAKLQKVAEMVVVNVETDLIQGHAARDADVHPDGFVHLPVVRKSSENTN